MIRLATPARASALALLMSSCVTTKEASVGALTANLYHLEDLDDASKTKQLTESDLAALRKTAGWIEGFGVKPHKAVGREGPLCPFVPLPVEPNSLSLAVEHFAGRSAADLVHIVSEYQQSLQVQTVEGDGTNY